MKQIMKVCGAIRCNISNVLYFTFVDARCKILQYETARIIKLADEVSQSSLMIFRRYVNAEEKYDKSSNF